MKTKNDGFTLLELMVTLTIAAVLLAIGVPSYNALVANSRITSAHNNLLGELGIARSEAVKRGEPVAICASSDGASCNSTEWEQGRLIFIDPNSNGDLDGGETLLRALGGSDGGVTIRTAAFTDTGAIVFNPDGSVNDTGTLFICDDRGTAFARGTNISLIGQPQKAYDTDSPANGTIDDVDGSEVTCP